MVSAEFAGPAALAVGRRNSRDSSQIWNYCTLETQPFLVFILRIRPLQHPDIGDVTVAGILHALSDPVRAAIVRALLDADEGLSCVEARARLELDMPKSTCSQHYRVLRESGLIESERNGVELTSRLRTREINARFPGLLESILKSYKREGAA